MQVQRAEGYISGKAGEQGRFGYKNVFHGVYSIVQHEGFFSLFKGKPRKFISLIFEGSIARVLYHTPATAISMGLLEYIRHAVSKVMY